MIANPSLDLPSSSVSIDDDAPPPTPPAGAGDAAEEDEPPVITPRLLRTVTAFATLPEKSAQHSYEQSDPSRPLSFDLRKNSGNLEHRVFKRRDSDLAEAASSPVPECSSRTAGAIAGTHGFGSSPVANSVVAARLGWASVKQSLFRSRKDSEKNAHVEMANMLKEFNVIMSTYIETNASMQVNLMGLTRLELSQISPVCQHEHWWSLDIGRPSALIERLLILTLLLLSGLSRCFCVRCRSGRNLPANGNGLLSPL